MNDFMLTWYDWGAFVGVFMAAAIAIYIFFDSQQLAQGTANVPRALSLGGLLLTLPSLYNRLTLVERLLDSLLTGEDNFELFFYLALAGLVLSIVALIYYVTSVRNVPEPYIPPPPPPPLPPTPAPMPAAPRPLDPTRPVQQEPSPKGWLVIRQGPRVGQQFGLGMSSPNVIGRDPNKADIIIDEDSVSREHARVRFENGQFILYDMASTGGTYVNGNMVQRQMLYDDDKIRLGRVEMTFKRVK